MRLFQPLYNGTGHSIYDPQTGKWTINRQAALDVCNFVNTVCNVEKLAPPLDFGIQNAVETILQESYMKEHKVGIWLSGNWMASNWAEGKQYAWENVTDEVGFAKIPTQSGQSPYYTSMSGGWVWCVPELSQQKDAAWEFIKFICQKDNSEDGPGSAESPDMCTNPYNDPAASCEGVHDIMGLRNSVRRWKSVRCFIRQSQRESRGL